MSKRTFKRGDVLRRKSDGLVFTVTSGGSIVALRVGASLIFDHGTASDIRARFEVAS